MEAVCKPTLAFTWLNHYDICIVQSCIILLACFVLRWLLHWLYIKLSWSTLYRLISLNIWYTRSHATLIHPSYSHMVKLTKTNSNAPARLVNYIIYRLKIKIKINIWVATQCRLANVAVSLKVSLNRSHGWVSYSNHACTTLQYGKVVSASASFM